MNDHRTNKKKKFENFINITIFLITIEQKHEFHWIILN